MLILYLFGKDQFLGKCKDRIIILRRFSICIFIMKPFWFYIPLAELVDIDKEIERLEKESGRLTGEIKRASGMLANPKFVDKAPAAKVEEEKAKLAKYTEMKAQVEERLAQLKK